MNSQQVQDIRLMYEAVYNEELREKADEYNNMISDQDIVEVATEYFYTYGLNGDGVNILIEKVGLDNFVEFVYSLSEDLYVLTEARRARRARPGGPSYKELQATIFAHDDAKAARAAARAAAMKKAKEEAKQRTETEKKEPESKGPDTEAKAQQPKKKPIRDAIARGILAGIERHRTGMNLAKQTGQTVGRVISTAGEAMRRASQSEIGKKIGDAPEFVYRLGREAGNSETGQKVKKAFGIGEEVENWVNFLVEEGYDLSEYTWDDMYEIYMNLDEGNRLEREYDVPNWDKVYNRTARDNPGLRGTSHQNTFVSNRQRRPSWETGNQITQGLSKGRVQRHRDRRGVKTKGLPESYDYFDYILEHLVAEGYADTNQDALIIMANMSEEWRNDIDTFLLERRREDKGRPRRRRDRPLEFVRSMNPGIMTKSGGTIADHEARRGVGKLQRQSQEIEIDPTTGKRTRIRPESEGPTPAKKVAMKRRPQAYPYPGDVYSRGDFGIRGYMSGD
jgi:hypothetical protein